MEIDWLKVFAGCVNASAGFGIGFNIGSFEKALKKLSKDPLRDDKYEELIKNRKDNGPMEFLDYYIGMPGRFLAYKIYDNPNFWE